MISKEASLQEPGIQGFNELLKWHISVQWKVWRLIWETETGHRIKTGV
jgi:hypothetical protein